METETEFLLDALTDSPTFHVLFWGPLVSKYVFDRAKTILMSLQKQSTMFSNLVIPW